MRHGQVFTKTTHVAHLVAVNGMDNGSAPRNNKALNMACVKRWNMDAMAQAFVSFHPGNTEAPPS